MKYALSDGSKGKIKFEWLSDAHKGLACNLDSIGFKALSEATKSVLGTCEPYSITGSLPLVKDLQVRCLLGLFSLFGRSTSTSVSC